MNFYTCVAIVCIFLSLGGAVASKYGAMERIKELEVEAVMVQGGYKKIYHKWYAQDRYHWERVFNFEEMK